MKRPHQLIALGLALMAPLASHAAIEYMKWVPVTMPAATGAACGNGTPYRIFVNLTPKTTKTMVFYEGGGACWTQKGCKGEGGLAESASNPNGVPENYFKQANLAAYGLSTPLITRTPLLGKIFTQDWNLVYVPYCTGDVHAGSSVAVYTDNDPTQPLTYQHKGYLNSKALAQWMKANLPRPEMLLVTGASAGGAGSTANYGLLRLTVNPVKARLVADSGPFFPAPQSGTKEQYPSLPLQNKVREVWGVDRPDGIATELITQFPDAGTVSDISSINTGLGKVFPQDRFGFMTFQNDGIYSAFSYTQFYPEIGALTGKPYEKALNVLWRKDIANWVTQLNTQSNAGYYIPTYRPFLKSHTLVQMDFTGTGIEEANVKSVVSFYENIVNSNAAPMRLVEKDQKSDYWRIVNPIQWIVALFEDAFL